MLFSDNQWNAIFSLNSQQILVNKVSNDENAELYHIMKKNVWLMKFHKFFKIQPGWTGHHPVSNPFIFLCELIYYIRLIFFKKPIIDVTCTNASLQDLLQVFHSCERDTNALSHTSLPDYRANIKIWVICFSIYLLLMFIAS